MNLSHREPVYMQCCGDTSCKQCVDEMFKQIVEPDEQIEDQVNTERRIGFICKLCRARYYNKAEK